MAEPEEIHACIEVLLSAANGALRGKRVLISAGGTREPLDAVRFVGNRSSGRMGVALAEEAGRRGAEVTLLAANLAVPTPPGVTVVDTPTAAELEREALARADADVIVMAAAVADYRPASPSDEKRAKDGAPWTVELEPTADVLVGHRGGSPGRTGDRGLRSRPWRPRSCAGTREAACEERGSLRLQRRQPARHRLRRARQRGRRALGERGANASRRHRSASSRQPCSTRWSGYSRLHDRRRTRGWACRSAVGGRRSSSASSRTSSAR